ncbi:hypothetical protein ADL27_15035, partial [Streptomyces sp. NRRL F-6602]
MPLAPSWDPAQYLRHAGHRTRPFAELLARVPDPATERPRVVDLGCGAGNVTALLAVTATEVVVELRKPPLELFGAKSGGTPANIIRFRVDGDTGIRAELMLRKPDADGTPVTVPVGIDFERVLGRQQLPYEAVLLGATVGNAEYFAFFPT